MFGIDDPWVWGGYVASFGTVILCCLYAWLKRDEVD